MAINDEFEVSVQLNYAFENLVRLFCYFIADLVGEGLSLGGLESPALQVGSNNSGGLLMDCGADLVKSPCFHDVHHLYS